MTGSEPEGVATVPPSMPVPSSGDELAAFAPLLEYLLTPQPDAAPCPRCGRWSTSRADAAWRCGTCGHTWPGGHRTTRIVARPDARPSDPTDPDLEHDPPT